MKELPKFTEVYEQFQNCENFKNGLDLNKQITRCVNFVEGRQWSNAKGTEDYPKITLNTMRQIKKVRQANILQNDYSFLVNTMMFEDTKKIQYFLKWQYNRMKIRKKNLKVIGDNFEKGTSGLYFYWDNNSRSTLSKETGELKAEVFDVRQLGVADPSIQNFQDQEWIIYCVREKVGALKKAYPDKKDEIFSDEYVKNMLSQREQVGIDDDEEFCSVYIKYFRNKEYQVCYTISTQLTLLQDTTFLNPYYEGSKEEEPNTLSINDDKEIKKYREAVFSTYPFARLVEDERDGCFYGIPSGYEYIEAQKSINAHYSTYDYALSQNVLGGFMYKKGVLGDQEITTDNAQMLELDLKPGERIQDALARIPVNNIPNDTLNYGAVLSSALKQAAGATNVQMGQADYSNQTAKATQMLLERAKENSSDYAILFEEYMKDVAEIIFMFSKFYYDKKEFNIVEHGNEKDTNTEFKGEKAFYGKDYILEDIGFDIQVSPSQSFNETILQQLAMMCVQTGNLKMLSVLKMLPYNTFPSFIELKDELVKEDTTMQIMKQQEQQLAQCQQVMQQMAQEYQKMQEKMKTMDTVVQENLRLKEQMTSVYAKAIEQSKNSSENYLEVQQQLAQVLQNKLSKKDK